MWFRVDDRLGSSRKVLAIRRGLRVQAIGLWALAGSWTAGEELNGFVPDYMVEEIGGDADLAAALVAAGLWDEVDGGWQFVNWAEWQPTREQLEAKREAERARKAEWRRKKDEKRSTTEVVPLGQAEDETGVSHVMSRGTDTSVHESSALTHPDPTRPDPTPVTPNGVTGEGPHKRGSRIPEPFLVSAGMREWAAERVPLVDVDTATERFVNHWRAKSGKDATKLDWAATWRNWLLRDQEYRASRTKLTPTERAMQTAAAGREFVGRTLTTLELEGSAS